MARRQSTRETRAIRIESLLFTILFADLIERLCVPAVQIVPTGERSMPWYDIRWTTPLIQKLALHGITPEDFEHVVTRSGNVTLSRSSGRPIAFGYTGDGRHIGCVYEIEEDGITLIPVSAFEAREPR